MKEAEIKEVLQRHQIAFAEHATLYGTVMAGVGAYNNGMGAMMHTMKDHILHLNQEGVAIIAIDDMKGILKEDSPVFIPRQNIQGLNIKVRLFGFQLSIQTDKGDILYKIRRSVLAAPWHKENLSFLLLGSLR